MMVSGQELACSIIEICANHPPMSSLGTKELSLETRLRIQPTNNKHKPSLVGVDTHGDAIGPLTKKRFIGDKMDDFIGSAAKYICTKSSSKQIQYSITKLDKDQVTKDEI